MDEQKWLASKNAGALLGHLAGRVRPRKVRLGLCGCLRAPTVWPLLTSKASRRAVEVSELFADGVASVGELGAARKSANAASGRIWRKRAAVDAAAVLANMVCLQDGNLLGYGFLHIVQTLKRNRLTMAAELVRDVFGNPFRTAGFQAAWRTPAVLALGQSAYEFRRLPAGTLEADRLAVLADALEEAGCADGELLGHLRGPGVHVRGCWALDLALAKSPAVTNRTKGAVSQGRTPRRLLFRETCLGEITDVAGSFPWMEGNFNPSPDAAPFQDFFRWMVDEENAGQDPPFEEALLDEDNWFVEEDDGIKVGITVPAVHEGDSISWRWR